MKNTAKKITAATKGMNLDQAIQYIETIGLNLKKIQSFAFGADFSVIGHPEFSKISIYLRDLESDAARVGYCFKS